MKARLQKNGLIKLSRGHFFNDSKFELMNFYRCTNDSLPDGAFFALAKEIKGWTAEDWAWFADEFAKRKTLERSAQRKA